MKDAFDRLGNTARRIATAGAIGGAGLMGSVAQPAQARPVNHHKAPFIYKADTQLNERAQKAADTLARRIIYGKVDQHGGMQFVQGPNNQKLADTTVTVAAPNLYGSEPAEYDFEVLSRVTSTGKPDLKNVVNVFLTSGESNGGYPVTKADVRLDFVENTTTAGRSFLGEYVAPNSSAVTTIEAGVIPTAAHEAHLTGAELTASIGQANGLIDSAIDKQYVGALPPAFPQPAHTVVNLLK